MIRIPAGLLISLEGIDGSGKSSVAAALHQALYKKGLYTVLTKEPGATALGAYLRTLLHTRSCAIQPQAEYLLFAADRAQHMHECVEPALTAGAIVISDRMADSSLAYQGFGRGLDRHMIRAINAWAMHQREPDITLYLKIDYPTACQRLRQRNEMLTAFEQEHAHFFERVIAGFEEIFSERTNVMVIDSTQPLDTVIDQAINQVCAYIYNRYTFAL